MSDRRSQVAVLYLVGVMALYLGGSDAALAYVKASLQPLLLASGAVLIGLGVVAAVRHTRDQDWHQPHGPRVAWLLALPALALVLIAPPALGAFAASRQPVLAPPTIQASPTDQAAGDEQDWIPPLIPNGDGAAVALTLTEYVVRDYDAPHTLAGVRVRLVGFVTPQQPGRDGYLLTRFAINCCAADATAYKVAVHGDPVPRGPDTWLEVEGRWQQRQQTTGSDPDQSSEEPPLLLAESIRVIEQPTLPYETGMSF